MSMFEDDHYRWRETYFVLFDSSKRPTLAAVEEKLCALNEHYEMRNQSADKKGRFESLTLLSPEDFAALDICYTDGDEVVDHTVTLAKEMESAACETGGAGDLQRLMQCDCRFDVLHFEQVSENEKENFLEDPDEMLDPSALLLVLGALARLTGGVAIDPQAGAFLDSSE
jgi:hypothetical protein